MLAGLSFCGIKRVILHAEFNGCGGEESSFGTRAKGGWDFVFSGAP